MNEVLVILGCVLIVVAIAVAIFFMRLKFTRKKDENEQPDWALIAEKMWKRIQPDLARINEIHEKTWNEGRKIRWSDKSTLEEAKEVVYSSKQSYEDYISLCEFRNVAIPEERKDFDLIIAETEDALVDPKHVLDNSLERACNRYDEVYARVNDSGENLYNTRMDSVDVIENVEVLINSIAKRPKSFETEFEEIRIYKEKFKSTVEFALEQKKVLEKSAVSAGAGVAAGGAVAAFAPSAAMWVATTFGTASTGTAISALSGAAATNAALAWLGGGALVAQGGGMAAGQALLLMAGPVGWGIAGTSVLASVLLAWRKKLKVEENKKNEIIRMKNCTASLRKLKARMESISLQTTSLTSNIDNQKDSCMKLSGKDYTLFTDEQKQNLGSLMS